MITQLLPLTIFGLALVAMLVWFIIGAKGHWIAKIVLTFILSMSSLAVWNTIYVFSGWPTYEPLPSKFRLHYAVVNEPNRDSLGSIKLWVTSKYEGRSLLENIDKTQPRAYSIPYSRENHKQIKDALQGIKNGQTVEMGMGGKNKGGNSKGKSSGRKGGESDSSPNSKPDGLYILPPSAPPLKGYEGELEAAPQPDNPNAFTEDSV